jgi:hypothetical protein
MYQSHVLYLNILQKQAGAAWFGTKVKDSRTTNIW